MDTELKEAFLYNIVYENILYSLFVFLGPLLILVSLNTCLVSSVPDKIMAGKNVPKIASILYRVAWWCNGRA